MEILKGVKIDGREFHQPDELSGGQRQRVSICHSLNNLNNYNNPYKSICISLDTGSSRDISVSVDCISSIS